MKILKPGKKEIRAIIFDFDATLMDTEEHWYLADKRLMAEYCIDFTKDMKKKYIGKSLDDMVNDLHKIYRLDVSKEEIKDKKNRFFLEISKGMIKMFPRMKKLYEYLRQLKIPMAIATGTDITVVTQVLEENNILNDFQFILTAAEVKKGKPFPDIYIETSRRLGIKPENTVVFEDSPYGVEAAVKAGSKCIAIPYLLNEKPEDVFYLSDVLIEGGMNCLDPELIRNWITGKY